MNVAATGVVFAGHGIVAPEYGWDDYGDVDVTDKLVIVLSGEPEPPGPSIFRGGTRTYYSTRENKYETARRRGAAGILVVTDAEKSETFATFRTFAELGAQSLPPLPGERSLAIAGLLTVKAMHRICGAVGVAFAELEQAAGTPGFRPRPLGSAARIDIDSKLRSFTSANVVARLTGSDPALSTEAVVFTAHWDHLGRNPALTGDQIYNGANDNAAGVAQLLEIARSLVALEARPKRSILFVATTGEESGFLGAKHYAAHPLVPLDRTVAAFNLDAANTFGVTRDVISAGYGNSTLDEVLAEAARLQGRKFVAESLDGDGSYYFASDQIAFALAGVPAAFPWSGFDYVGKAPDFGEKAWRDYGEHRYHQVSDIVLPDWNMAGAVEDARWLVIAAYLTAQESGRPAWKPGVEFRRPQPLCQGGTHRRIGVAAEP
ncbi:MAG: M20/M25/M40 family metallo-hydrolase [Thermoanaerobaculia bacterium]